ncbi:hypothetical protein IG197_01760 [Aminobacter sp. SR38]|jgi:hypothetical protein|uniref:hypothetical protein n=1 Tax=Aminobacter sp. SR38 TaxID=2774562 RepID=UPI00178279F6|nr:hypothetical protein [Aminobacter sp. SR38]QOF71843.1 hypothetical protein IG197_01760 [Aminobacter sp. SR38]
MTALILSALTNPTLLAIMGGLLFGLITFFKGNSRGAAKERVKREAEEAKARDVLDDVQSDVGAMSADQVRAELAKRARP